MRISDWSSDVCSSDLGRIKDLFLDPRTWSTVLYFLAMLPLGILYFTLAVSFVSVALSLVLAPLALLPGVHLNVWMFGFAVQARPPGLFPRLTGSALRRLLVTLHLAHGFARRTGLFPKNFRGNRGHFTSR